ncbi:MAG: stage II sporulation protein P [Clostridia bacterium]|nr:stage II sporulation protein P [Clostridia bacterium]
MDKNRLPVILNSRVPSEDVRAVKGKTDRKSEKARPRRRRPLSLGGMAALCLCTLILLFLMLSAAKNSPVGSPFSSLFGFLFQQSFPAPTGTTPPPLPSDTESADTPSSEMTEEPSTQSEESTASPETDTDAATDTTAETDNVESTETESESKADTTPEVETQGSHISDESYSEKGASYINNTTILAPDVNKLLDSPLPNVGAVLIVTSRPNEAYNGGNGNVSDIATLVADRLSRNGIQALYALPPEDVDSAAVMEYYLNLYPEVGLVLDLRRSAELRPDGELLRPLCSIDSIPHAQIRLICDSRGEGADMTDKNLAFALKLRAEIFDAHQQLSRPVWLREGNSPYRSDVLFLTVEIGAAGNTFAEAVSAAELFSAVLSEFLSNG